MAHYSPITPLGNHSNNRYHKDHEVKHFNDPIHGSIKMEGICLKIIDSVEFQRLHHLKQLGCCDHVFRGATHTRFIHSLGVAHLAEKLLMTIRRNQPDLNLTDVDITCVKIAGLCHDLGHGPFSHVFDGLFMKKIHSEGNDTKGKSWKHEQGSVSMLRHIIEKNNIDITTYGLNKIDIIFIEEMILGITSASRQGRPSSKFYLYDIVNNIASGLDVDKMDYLARDTHMSNVKVQSDFSRFITNAMVFPADKINDEVNHIDKHPLTICYPEKLAAEAIHIFGARYRMHQVVYTHKTVKQIEYMVVDALVAADPYIRIHGTCTDAHPKGLYKMSECYQDMTAMSKLKDSILDIIDNDPSSDLDKARHILNRIYTRDLYTCIGITSYCRDDDVDKLTATQIKNAIIKEAYNLVPPKYKTPHDRIFSPASSRLSAIEEIHETSHHTDNRNVANDHNTSATSSMSLFHTATHSPRRTSTSNNDTTSYNSNSNSNGNKRKLMAEFDTTVDSDSNDTSEVQTNHEDSDDTHNVKTYTSDSVPKKRNVTHQQQEDDSNNTNSYNQSDNSEQDQDDDEDDDNNNRDGDNSDDDDDDDDDEEEVEDIFGEMHPEYKHKPKKSRKITTITTSKRHVRYHRQELIHSQYEDSSNMSLASTDVRNPLTADDLIVELMNIHHGLKDKNPVSQMRFYSKYSSNTTRHHSSSPNTNKDYNSNTTTTYNNTTANMPIGKMIDEDVYRAQLPSVYEDKKIRVFCKYKNKIHLARKAFDQWCKSVNTHTPFPSSQPEEYYADDSIF